ncbi:unnamed protein product [Diabrotica balteata]|uniref:Thaumatin-like protein n=1 Tax=Diabrotica balteata TaxID=107213 RepID=A0A9N9TC36_DIABA|nr:unnamed protein product [Diabrotica balteata]
MLQFVCLAVVVAAVSAAEFEFRNREGGPVWVGIQGNPGHPHLEGGGFKLAQGQSRTIGAPDNWAGRFWGRTWCDDGSNHCLTGDCGNRVQCNGAGGVPPASLAEITMKGAGGLDFYDISFVDGYNIAISFEPVGGQGDGGQYSCKRAQCLRHLNDGCPNELKVMGPNGFAIACKSACLAFNTDQYCCRGAFGTPETCKSSTWPRNYPQEVFKSQCPDAYSYAYDDHKSTFTCKASKYIVQFGV